MRYLKNNREWLLHFNMAILGGFMGTYALLLRNGTFGSAMTGNFMEMMIDIAEVLVEGNYGLWMDLLIRLGAVVVFGAALVISHILKEHTTYPLQKITLAVEGIGFLLASLLPADLDPVLGLYPIFFVSAFQWGCFSGVTEFGCATIFSTNNFRQCVTAWAEYLISRDMKMHKKGCFYGITILHFLFGALVGAVLTLLFGPKGLLGAFLFLAAGWNLL